LLFVGLGLLIVVHFSNTLQVTIAGESISEAAPRLAKRDPAVDEPARKARELADTCDGPIGWHGCLSTRDAIPTAHRAVPDWTQHTGAVIIRDPRLTRARTLSDQRDVGLTATFVFPTACGGRDTAA
jgi:hypothetical protein